MRMGVVFLFTAEFLVPETVPDTAEHALNSDLLNKSASSQRKKNDLYSPNPEQAPELPKGGLGTRAAVGSGREKQRALCGPG